MFHGTPFVIPRLCRISANLIFSESFFCLVFFAHCSFYPLYPPAEGVPIDFSLAPEALQMSTDPDILILPSDLAHFVRVR